MFEDQQPDELNNQDQGLNESIDSSITGDNIENIVEPEPLMPENISKEENPSLQQFTQEIAPEISPELFSQTEDITQETPVTVQPVQFTSFDEEENVHGKENRNLDLLMNVNLQMSVELGRTELPFKKVLELTRGSIISLDKLAGEPVELFANGKLVAFGEVVVIEDNFGLRITSIAAPEERLKTVHGDNKE